MTGPDVCVTNKRPAAHEAVAFSPQTAFSRGAKSPKRLDLAGPRGQKSDVKGHVEGQIVDAVVLERVHWVILGSMRWLPTSLRSQEGVDAIYYSGCCPLQPCLSAGSKYSTSNGMASTRPDLT